MPIQNEAGMEQSAVEKTRIVPFSCIEIFHKSTFSCSFFQFLILPHGVEWLAFWPTEKGREMEVSKYTTLYCVWCSCLSCSDPVSFFLLRCENLDRLTLIFFCSPHCSFASLSCSCLFFLDVSIDLGIRHRRAARASRIN